MSETNPLLSLEPLALPFDRVRGEHVEPAIRELLERSRARLAAAAASGGRTFDDVLGVLDRGTEPLDVAMTLVGHLESVLADPAIRAAYNAVKPEVSAFFAGIALDPALWQALKAYAGSSEAASLAGPRRRFLQKTVDEFRRNGADLPPEGKKRLEELTRELATLTSTFSQHTVDATAAWELVLEDEARLSGLPASAKEAAAQSASLKGKRGYRFTLQAPSYIPVMTYADDAELRETMYRAYATRAASGALDNRPVLLRILELRREQASLLGYRTFADLVLEDRMAHDGAKALAFVEELRRRTEPFFAREKAELEAFRRELEGPSAPPLAAWDVGYYAEKLRQARFDFDEEELRPYFSVEASLSGVFELAKRLYGLRIEPRPEAPVWHESVRAYSVREADGTLRAVFYADLHPREGKRDGAWMNGLVTGGPRPGSRAPHVALIAGNLTPPVGGKPALLTHGEVETLFHEFGHLLHHMLSDVELRSQGGTNVAWDFVELPSQILENWCWEREALDTFARHHETGAPIPEELYGKMVKARTFRAASDTMRQLGFASLDLALHVTYDPAKDGDPVSFTREILQRHSPAPLPSEHAMLCGFGHLFSSAVGYAAGYYSYKWAEVLDADAFSRFKERGVFDAETGRRFRDAILSKGDAADPMELYRDFMGREPRLDALLERSGLVGAPPSA